MGRILVLFVFVFFTEVYFSQSDCVDYTVKKQPAMMKINGIRFCGDEITISEKRYDVLNFKDLGYSVEITFGYPEYGGRKMGAIAIEKGTGEVQAIIELYQAPDDPSTKRKGNLILQKKVTAKERALRLEEEQATNLKIDKSRYLSINDALVKKDFETAKSEMSLLIYPEKYPKMKEFRLLERNYLLTNDKNQYPQIEKLMIKDSLIQAFNKTNQLNYPTEFPRWNELISRIDNKTIIQINFFLEKNDSRSALDLVKKLNVRHPEIENKVETFIEKQEKQKLEKIQTYLSERNIERATKTYTELKTPNIKIKEQIIDSIISYYSDKGIENESEEFQKEIIDENIPILLNLEKGKYKVFIDKNGNAKVENFSLQSVRTFKLKKLELNGFKVHLSNYFFINIRTDTVLASTTYYCLSDKTPVYKTLDNKFYYKVKNSQAQEVSLLIDMMIPKNVIKINKNYQTETYANAIPIKQHFSVEEPKFIPILKKD